MEYIVFIILTFLFLWWAILYNKTKDSVKERVVLKSENSNFKSLFKYINALEEKYPEAHGMFKEMFLTDFSEKKFYENMQYYKFVGAPLEFACVVLYTIASKNYLAINYKLNEQPFARAKWREQIPEQVWKNVALDCLTTLRFREYNSNSFSVWLNDDFYKQQNCELITDLLSNLGNVIHCMNIFDEPIKYFCVTRDKKDNIINFTLSLYNHKYEFKNDKYKALVYLIIQPNIRIAFDSYKLEELEYGEEYCLILKKFGTEILRIDFFKEEIVVDDDLI